MPRKQSALSQIERQAYLANRAAGDVRAFQQGGILGLLLRVGKRDVRRTVRRRTRGWLG